MEEERQRKSQCFIINSWRFLFLQGLTCPDPLLPPGQKPHTHQSQTPSIGTISLGSGVGAWPRVEGKQAGRTPQVWVGQSLHGPPGRWGEENLGIEHREGATDVGPPRWLSFGRHSSPSLSTPGLACGAEWQALPLSLTSCPSFGPVPWYKHPFPQSAPLLPVPSSSKLSLLRGARCHTAVTSIPLPSPLLECRIRTEIPSPDPAQPLEEGPLSSQSTGCDPVSWTLSMTGAAGQTSRIQEVGVYRALQARWNSNSCPSPEATHLPPLLSSFFLPHLGWAWCQAFIRGVGTK